MSLLSGCETVLGFEHHLEEAYRRRIYIFFHDSHHKTKSDPSVNSNAIFFLGRCGSHWTILFEMVRLLS